MKDALLLEANHFESSYLENLGNGKFKLILLPTPIQFAPVNGLVTDDVNEDGNMDVIMIGNDYGNEVFVGRYDALKGVVLLGDGKGKFEIITALKSGFMVTGDAKGLAKLYRANEEEIFIATQNLDSLKVYRKNRPSVEKTKTLSIEPMDSWAEFIYADGRKTKVEFHYGSGYLSQSTRKATVPAGVKEIIVYTFKGDSRKVQGLANTLVNN